MEIYYKDKDEDEFKKSIDVSFESMIKIYVLLSLASIGIMWGILILLGALFAIIGLI